MTASHQQSRTFSKILFVGLLLVIACTILYAALHKSEWSWPVPEEAKQLKNPLQPNEVALNSAKRVYEDKCVRCHGDSGKGDGRDAVRYDPKPADLTDQKRMSGVSDGELFYKISEGKKPMPAFKTRLTEEQRWELVLLIRSFISPPGDASPSTQSRE